MIHVAVVALVRQDRVFLQRRDAQATFLPGLWELPGGKIEAGEGAEVAARRELREELGVGLQDLQPLGGPVEAGSQGVRLLAFRARPMGPPTTDLAWGWFTPEEALRLPLPPATRPVLAALGKELSAT